MKVRKPNTKGKTKQQIAKMKKDAKDKFDLYNEIIFSPTESSEHYNTAKMLKDAHDLCPCDDELIHVPELDSEAKCFRCPNCGCDHYFSKELEDGES